MQRLVFLMLGLPVERQSYADFTRVERANERRLDRKRRAVPGIDQIYTERTKRRNGFFQYIPRFEQVEPAEQARNAVFPRPRLCRSNGTANSAVRTAAFAERIEALAIANCDTANS